MSPEETILCSRTSIHPIYFDTGADDSCCDTAIKLFSKINEKTRKVISMSFFKLLFLMQELMLREPT